MYITVEDALVDWYEAERLARHPNAELKQAGVVALNQVSRNNDSALDRLFEAVDALLFKLTILHPAADASEIVKTPIRRSSSC